MPLIIQLSRQGRSDLLVSLRENGLEFYEKSPSLGAAVAASTFIEIASVLGPPLALALGKWLGRRDNRRLLFTLRDNKIQQFDARGYSVDKVIELLSETARITAVESRSRKDTSK
jgi:hypothetical protein